MIEVGKIYSAKTSYYDSRKGCDSFKFRPVLVISEERNNDYIVMPISSIIHREHIDYDYDIELDITKYRKLNLTKTSYLRTHKQMPVHRASIVRLIGDLKGNYEDLFIIAMMKREQYNNETTERVLEP